MQIDVNTKDNRFETLLARLGISGGLA